MNAKLMSVLVVLMLLLGGCSSVPEDKVASAETNSAEQDPRDPLEGINRPIWDFNYDVLDKYILRPVAKGYSNVPKPVRTSLLNMALNLDEPVTVVNDLLQFKLKDASVATGRFLINSTIGILGLFDVASDMGLERKEEDFGQTLGVWGSDDGAYLMLPAMGPSTVRNTTGDLVDSTLFSFNLLELPQTILKVTIKVLDTRVELMEQEQLLLNSFDPYTFTKEAYLQRQLYDLHDGEVPESESGDDELDLDELDDLDDLDEEDEDTSDEAPN